MGFHVAMKRLKKFHLSSDAYLMFLHCFQKSENDSPYLPIKSGGVFVSKQPSSQKRTMISHSSILTKKARTDQARPKNVRIHMTISVHLIAVCTKAV